MKYQVYSKVTNSSFTKFDELTQNGCTFTIEGKEVLVTKNLRTESWDFKLVGDGEHVHVSYGTNVDVIHNVIASAPDGITLTWLPQEVINTREMDDGLTSGQYLAMYFNTNNRTIDFDVMTVYKPNSLCHIGGCFDFDVQHYKKILGYVKLGDIDER